MQRCGNCNAPIPDDAESCQFCSTETERGRRLRLERAQRLEVEQREAQRKADQAAAASRSRALAEASGAANRSLMWSLLGLLACCLPLGPIIGIVTARRAKELAVQGGTSTGHAHVALGVGIACALLSVAGWSTIALIARAEANRKTELEVLIAKGVGDAALTSATACALTELELMNSKYRDYDWLNTGLTCGTQLTVTGSEAVLEGSHFTKDQQRVPVVACFHRGDRWGIAQVRPDARCDQPPPLPEPEDSGPKRKRAP